MNMQLCRLGHVNKISCFSSFCLQKFGEGGGYLLFIFRGQRSHATIFTGVKLEESRNNTGQKRVKTNKKTGLIIYGCTNAYS